MEHILKIGPSYTALVAMSATEKTEARRGVWRREFVMLVKVAEKMTFEESTEDAEGVSHADICGRQGTKQEQRT